jgi:hypothetical protein
MMGWFINCLLRIGEKRYNAQYEAYVVEIEKDVPVK